MYYPTLEQFEEYARNANLVPVYREISADLETPVSAYLKVARPPYSYPVSYTHLTLPTKRIV